MLFSLGSVSKTALTHLICEGLATLINKPQENGQEKNADNPTKHQVKAPKQNVNMCKMASLQLQFLLRAVLACSVPVKLKYSVQHWL